MPIQLTKTEQLPSFDSLKEGALFTVHDRLYLKVNEISLLSKLKANCILVNTGVWQFMSVDQAVVKVPAQSIMYNPPT